MKMLSIPLAANMSLHSNFIIRKPIFSSASACPINLTQPCKTNSSVFRFRLAGRQKCEVSGIDNEKNLQIELAAGVEERGIPKHVALIMDGNRRWAKSKGLPIFLGHRAGGKAFLQLLTNCLNYGVKVLTVFAFSTENWIRPQGEVDFLHDLSEEVISLETEKLTNDGVRLSFIGSRMPLRKSLQKVMADAEERTKDNRRMQVVVALNYGGRYDITEATKKIATKVKDGMLEVDDIDNRVLEQHLETNGLEFPNPDLLIRSSGEFRVSNFMLWQLAYTEMFFTNKVFPEFGDTDFVEAITAFQLRQRRYGGY